VDDDDVLLGIDVDPVAEGAPQGSAAGAIRAIASMVARASLDLMTSLLSRAYLAAG
jgi:hypothetical protein